MLKFLHCFLGFCNFAEKTMSSEKFRNRYRISSARSQWWDYGNNATYFVTICTANRECYFGEIVNFVETHNVETHNCASLQSRQSQPNKFGRQSQNLGSVIRGFKSSLKRYANENDINFAWQPRFHDRIIRNENEYKRVVNYIVNNPKNWGNDRLNSP